MQETLISKSERPGSRKSGLYSCKYCMFFVFLFLLSTVHMIMYPNGLPNTLHLVVKKVQSTVKCSSI
jgi:hypothetical protein